MSAWPRLLAILLVSGAIGCGSDDEPPPTGPMTVTVSHYDYQFDLESRAATSTLTLLVEQGGDCVTLPMRAESPTGITLGGEPAVSQSLEDGQLTVCGAGYFEGETLELSVSLTVPLETWDDLQVGYSVSTDLEGQPFYYLLSWVGECDRFGPCDTAPAHFATYHFAVTHPSGVQVLCPGTITAGDTLTECDFAWPGGPTYSTFSFAASPSWVEHDLGSTDGITVTLYDTPSSGVADDIDVDRTLAFIHWMIDEFGPYPYGDQLRLATGPTVWLGFEHPGNIVLYDQLDRLSSTFYDQLNHTVQHEIVHMWAGNQTTLADLYDFSFKEGAAEYLTFLFEEEQLSSVAQSRMTSSGWKAAAAHNPDYYPVPLDHPSLVDFSGVAYGPGPMTLFRQFEALYDRETVMVALADLLGQPRAVGVADVKDAMERATGADLDAYYDRWVYGEGAPNWPHFTVTLDDLGDGDVSVQVAQDAPEDGLYGCAFSLWLQNTDTDQQLDVWIDLGLDGMAEKTVTAHPGFEITRTLFDPESYCLANLPSVATKVAVPSPWRAPTTPLPYRL